MARKRTIPNGYVIYRGPSMIDGSPIIMISTGHADKSDNTKTGAMIQTWIMREDVDPLVASHTGKDESVCGGCTHRGTIIEDSSTPTGFKNIDRTCYVKLFQAPLNVWRTEKRGMYPDATVYDLNTLFGDKAVRFGSYGDPAAIPLWLIDSIGGLAKFTTGYTHQWRDCERGYSKWLMASADNAGDRFFARANGFRTFRVKGEDDDLGNSEISCPASKEMGQKTVCAECKACGGTNAKAKVDIAINAHGDALVQNNYKKRKDIFAGKKAA